MAIKKYTSGAWVPTTYRKFGTETDTITSLPAQIIGDGQPITSCQISGNTVQDGTPTPEAPVDVVGCGVWDETQQSYKLPPTVNGTEYPIYLGQVESTRRVKKLVLTGKEPNWNVGSTGLWHLQISDTPAVTILDSRSLYCTHYNGVASKTTYSGLTNGNACIYASVYIWIRDSQFASLSNFKVYLAAQYAAGTPVTVWYVLATPETAVVNEPLMKIGDYADTVTVANVPTTGTPENFDVGTTLKPSEVQLTYHGWHEHDDTKYTQGE